MTVEDELLELRRLFLTSLSDQLKSKTVTGSVLAVVERVLSCAGLLGKQTPPSPLLDAASLPFKATEQHEADTDEQQSTASFDVGPLPFPRGGDADAAKPTSNDEVWRPLERPFTVA